MQSSPKYVAQLFFAGLSADVSPELIDPKAGTVIEAHGFGISRLYKNILRVIRGDKSFAIGSLPSGTTTSTIHFIGGMWLNGETIVFYRDSETDLTYVYSNGVLIAQNADLPQQMFDCDTNDESSEIVITDNVTVPIVLNLNEMLAAQIAGELTYFDDYNVKLYSVNKTLQLNQPVFVQLEDLGAGAGLKFGSYSYAMCYASKNNESTPWGPVSPYIPVPESAVSLLSNAVEPYAAGLKTWGGEPSPTPGRYGIRLKLRITNLSGFDYIKIKRLANQTGQPISYTPAAEFVILTTDAFGGLIDIKADPYSIIEFIDSDTLDWAILDDSVTSAYSTIKTARTARFYDRRIILGGIEYESKLMSAENKSDMFLTEQGVNRIAFPIVKLLDSGKVAGGFSSIYNQVFNKSLRLGEKYGFGIKLNDEQGNTLFTVPIKHGEELKDDFTDFQFPNRRDKIPVGVARVDRIWLSGTIGSANIECDGVTTVATFHNTLTQTAIDFVNDNAAAYIGGGVIVTAYGPYILFRSTVAGVDFSTDTSITPIAGGNLAGTVVTTQANASPVRQEDLVLFGDVSGTATIVCSTSTTTVSRTISTSGTNAITAAEAFVTSYYNDYHHMAVDITVDYVNRGVKLTGPINGDPITTTASGTLVLTTNAVSHPVLPVLEKLRIDTITFSPTNPVGTVDITCHGITKPMVWDRTWYNTINTFITNYGADYLPIVVSLDIFQVNKLFFTGSFSEATTVVTHTGSNLAGTVAPTQPYVAGDKQIDIAVFNDVGPSTIQVDVTGGGIHFVSVTGASTALLRSAFLAEETANHGWAAIGVTIGGTVDGIRITGPVGKAITVTGYPFDITSVQSSSVSTAQIDTITLTGTVGNALITCGGLARSITYTSSKAATATKFYNDYRFIYAGVGIDILNSGETIICTALDANVPFTSSIVNAADTLVGVSAITQAAASPIAQVDVVTLLGTSGTVDITCQGLMHSVTYSLSLDVTAINFYTNFHTEYLATKGVTVGYSGGTITFTGPANGTAIVTTATGTLVDNIYTIVSPVTGTAQIDKVTITGASGNATITCNGVTSGVSYITSPTLTASRFVEQNAEAYLPQVEVTSSGADIFFRVLRNIGIGLTGVTTITNTVGTLNGTRYHVKDNSSGSSEGVFSPNALEDSTIDSWAGADVGFVYDPVKARRVVKSTSTPTELNIVSVADPTGGLVKPYEPITPTGRGNRPSQNKYDDIINVNIMNTVDGVNDFGVGQYGKFISTVGLRLGGIDTTKLPASVKSFSVVRTPAAGRVVCQGIGMYALTEQAYDATNPSLVKAVDKLWFYSPELDSVIGNKSHIYEDIKTNPSNYTIQLVAPCGFFSDFYSSYVDLQLGRKRQDFVSMPICGAGADARPMFPPDVAETNYISFGKWRNTTQGAGLVNHDLTFVITGAQDVPNTKIRVPYLELTLSAEIYANTDVKNESSSTPQSKEFHEPWYIINIIQNKSVPNNNINSYNDIGHSIRLESILGLSTGEASQIFPLVEERPEDVYSLNDTETTYRYIWVDGLPWLDSNNLTGIATYLTTLKAAEEFIPTGGLKCYGIYTYDPISNSIIFDQVLPTSLKSVVPVAGARVAVRYNSNSPIEVFLGDTYVADASFLAVDTKLVGPNTFTNDGFVLHAPMPHYNFEFKTSYHQAYVPEVGAVHGDIWEDQGTHNVGLIRQWLVNFTCESSVNLPLAYKNFFPNKLYAMRPALFTDKLDTETIAEFFTRMKIYPEYNDDYPDEYLNWGYGGFSTPASVNYDYEKLLPLKSYAAPKSGANELLSLMKRFHYSTQNLPGYVSNRVFIPTNIYDLKNDKASQISILYDDFSERGSNLYVITDRGAGMLLTNKQMITTAEGNNLTILANDASLIKGEVWLNSSIGCPKEFWRGKSEGSIKLPNNIVANVLVFPSQDDIVMFSNNNFVQIADNNRQAILASLESVDLTENFTTKLYSVIDQGKNKLWITIDTTTYTFNFDINNWDGSVKSISFDKSFNAKYLTGEVDRNVLVHALNKTGQFGLSMSHNLAVRYTTIGDDPYVIFSVTPELGRAVEFIDMFISASDAPYSIEIATNKEFTNSITVLGTILQEYKPGLYYLQKIPRLNDLKVAQSKTLFVKIRFAGTLLFYDIRMTKIGYKLISGN